MAIEARKYLRNTVSGLWEPVPSIVPSDTLANPADAEQVASLLMAWDGAQWLRPRAGQSADGAANALNALRTLARGETFDGATWHRLRGNEEKVILPAGVARNASTASAMQVNRNARGLQIGINVTALDPGVTVLLTVFARVDAAGTYQERQLLQAPAAIAAVGWQAFQIYPGLDPATPPGTAPNQFDAVANGVLPRTWYAYVIHGGAAGNATYGVAACEIL